MGNKGLGFFISCRNFVRDAYRDALEQNTTIVEILEAQNKDLGGNVNTGVTITGASANNTTLNKASNNSDGARYSDLSQIYDYLLSLAENAPENVDDNLKMKFYLLKKIYDGEYEWRRKHFCNFNQFVYRTKIR